MSENPFSPDNIGVIQWITLARIYDVLMALLTTKNPDMAKELLEMHAKGLLMGTTPAFLGTFISDAFVESENTPPE